ncbi:Penicillin-binding protein 1C [BD1-7 clade bacterium]|uniref:peptidoglycan glycosyltransferase n=1 Tax=BD1-7 clade bacterium TaxID=2029982 RepID=A0A5S9R0M5_9GAMM|nr:Penicillin-binding protein 1C [BD1-7 clade bacterium]
MKESRFSSLRGLSNRSITCLLSGLLAAIAVIFYIALQPIPHIRLQPPVSPVMLDVDGKLLGARVANDGQWRLHHADALPDKYITALLAFEDRRFYWHLGVDPIAVIRAGVRNWQHDGVVSGASTLTMQLARLLNPQHRRNLPNKVREAALALKLETTFNKQEILQIYANLAPFGGNTVGIASATWRYFSVPVADISWAQAALLAVLPKNPSDLRLGKNRDRLKDRRDNLLRRLSKQQVFDHETLKLALLEPLPKAPAPMPNAAPHWFTQLQQLNPETREHRSTLRADLQQQLTTITASHVRRIAEDGASNIAAVVIDNTTQSVVAYVGNQAASDLRHHAKYVDIANSPRSSGSLFKPFLYALMLQQGDILPPSLILDIPTNYRGYQPENYDHHFRGAVSAAETLRQSLNVPSVRMLQKYGVEAFKQDLESMGLTTLFRRADDYGLSLILGGAEVTLLEITHVYSGLLESAAGRQSAGSVLKETGETKPNRRETSITTKPESPFVIRQGAAWLTLQTMAELNRPDTQRHWRAFSSSPSIAWKTGTSYGLRDAWAIGSNNDYTVGIWAGNANGSEGIQLSGTRTAAPVLLDVFRALPAAALPPQPTFALKSYRVCEADGYLANAGCKTVETWGPIDTDFTRRSPWHFEVHVDENGMQVHGHCESPFNMTRHSVFQLPPIANFYYQQTATNISPPPAMRSDCNLNPASMADKALMEIEYPTEGANIALPVKLDGTRAQLIVKARHNRANKTLFWHLDRTYIGKTRHAHELAIDVRIGWHKLILIDGDGYQLERWFKVL